MKYISYKHLFFSFVNRSIIHSIGTDTINRCINNASHSPFYQIYIFVAETPEDQNVDMWIILKSNNMDFKNQTVWTYFRGHTQNT